jgi:hypothetical protein
MKKLIVTDPVWICGSDLIWSDIRCYKNTCSWHGPYSFSSSLSLSTYTRKTMHAYTCNTYSGWLYSSCIFTGCIPFDHVSTFSVLYLLTGFPAWLPMPFPFHWYQPYYIWSPLPYYWSMMSSPLTLTTSPVGDSAPVTFTIALVCDSVSPLPLPYRRYLTQSPFCLPVSVLLLTAWSVPKFLTYINPLYYSCIL